MSSGTSVVAATWVLAALCAVALVVRSVIKMRAIRHIGADDVFIWAGFICFIGACAAAQLQVRYGLGSPTKTLPKDIENSELKASYAKYLLYEPVIAFAKLSVVSVLRKCALGSKDRLSLYMFEWFLVIWAFTSEFVWAFSCQMPEPWNHNGKCINRFAWLASFETMNILTEILLILIPTVSITRMSLSRKDKLIASSFFWARIVIIPASISRIVYNAKETGGTLSDVPFVIATMVLAALEILAACVLYARPLFRILESGSFTISRRGSSSHLPGTLLFDPSLKGSWPLTQIPSFGEKHMSGYSAQVLVNGQYVDKDDSEQTDDIQVRHQWNVLSDNAQRIDTKRTRTAELPTNAAQSGDGYQRESVVLPLEATESRTNDHQSRSTKHWNGQRPPAAVTRPQQKGTYHYA